MRRSLKNYLCVLVLAAAVYFMGMTYLRAEETRARQIRIERTEDVRLPVGWYVLTGVEGMIICLDAFYLIASKGNKKTFRQTMDSIPVSTIGVLSGVIGGAGGVMLSVYVIGAMPAFSMPELQLPEEKITATEPEVMEEPYVFPVPELPEVLPVTNLSSQAAGLVSVDDVQDIIDSYQCGEPDISTILANPGAQVSLISASFAKSGDSSDPDSALSYGLNADVYVRENAAANILGSSLVSAAAGAPGAVCNGSGSVISMSDSSIATRGPYSPALMALFSGSISAGNDQLATYGDQSAVLYAADNGSASMSSGSLNSYGALSPLIFAQGNVDLSSIYGNARSSAAADLRAGSSLSLNGCTLSAAGLSEAGREGLIYADGSSEYRIRRTYINLTSNSISATAVANGETPVPLFHTDGGETEIHLSQNAFRAPSGLFAFLQSGLVDMTLDGQSVYGSYVVDGSGTLNMNLLNGSSYSGMINSENTGAQISLHADASSTISLTGNTYLSEFSNDAPDNSNIAFNGYMIYVNGEPIV